MKLKFQKTKSKKSSRYILVHFLFYFSKIKDKSLKLSKQNILSATASDVNILSPFHSHERGEIII